MCIYIYTYGRVFFKKKNGHDGESIHSCLSVHHPTGILRVNFPAIDVSTESMFFLPISMGFYGGLVVVYGILWWFNMI